MGFAIFTIVDKSSNTFFYREELKEKYENKLEKELSGPTFEVLGKVMKVILGRKISGPGAFVGHSGTPAVGCSYKAAAGYLYPLERGFMYVHKPPIHIRFEEVASVNFARGGGNTRSFDFEIELKSGTGHTFSSIEKEEYNKLFDFITSKKLNIKNRSKNVSIKLEPKVCTKSTNSLESSFDHNHDLSMNHYLKNVWINLKTFYNNYSTRRLFWDVREKLNTNCTYCIIIIDILFSVLIWNW